VTVRQKIDQLAAEPPVRDLGYAADQRLVASALLGLQLLADEIDELRSEHETTPSPGARRFAEPPGAGVVEDDTVTTNHDSEDERGDEDDRAAIADVVDQLAELTAQMKKLTKAVRRSTESGAKPKKQKKTKSR
jgi:hypothetical protein